MQAVHPVFHVSMLEPSIPNTIPNRTEPPPAPVVIDGEPEYKVTEILDSKIDRRQRPCNLLHLVRWSGYEGTDEETSWLLATDVMSWGRTEGVPRFYIFGEDSASAYVLRHQTSTVLEFQARDRRGFGRSDGEFEGQSMSISD